MARQQTDKPSDPHRRLLRPSCSTREVFLTSAQADDGLARFSGYYNYHRLHGELDWHTPAERYEGTPFIDRGFEHVPALVHLQDWLTELMAA